MLSEKAKSRAQQRFFGMVRAAQKGEMENPSSEVLDAADSMKVDDVKKFAKTKHKGLPEKKKIEEAAFLAGLAKGAVVAAKGAVKGAVKQKAKEVVAQKAVNVAAGAIPQPNMSESKGTAELAAIKLRGKKACAVCGSLTHATGQCPKKEHDVNEGVGRMIGTVAGTVAKAAKAVNREVLPIKHAKNLEQEVKKGYEASKPKEVKKKINKKRNILQKGIGKVARAVSSKTDKIASTMGEAKVDKGRSDYGKATIRNWRHSGPDTVEPAMFDPENKRGKTIDKRRKEHEERRRVKGAKVPVYTKEDKVPPKVPLKNTGNPLQNAWNKFAPPPESSNSPCVRSGKCTPGKLEAPGLKLMNNTAKKINQPIKTASKIAKVAVPVAAGLAVSKGVDSLMKMGKKKKIKEQILDELNLDELKLFGKKGSGAIFYNDPKGRRDALKTTGKDPGVVNKPAVDNAVKNVKTNVTNKVKSVVTPVQKTVQKSIDTQTNRAGANIGNQISTRVKPAVSSGVADGIKQGATAVGKAALKGAGAVGAGLAVSKGVDSVMKGGKKKTNEELSIVDKMLVEYSPKVVSEEELAEKDTYTVKDGSGKKYEFGTHPAFKPGAKKPKSKVKPFKTEYDPSDDDTFDPHEAEATRGQSGRGTSGKMNVRKKYPVKEASVALAANTKIRTEKERKKGKAELAKLTHIYKGMKTGQYNSHEPEGELVDETYFDTNRRGISTKGGFVKQYNKPGKLSRASLNHERKSKNPELRMSKKELRKSMEDDANYEKKMGRSKPTPSNLKTALKKMNKEEVQSEESYRVLASSDGQEKPSQFSYKDEKTAKKYADSIKKGGGKATVVKEDIGSFRDYMANVEAAKKRQQDKQDNRKKKDDAYIERVRKGIKFYDSKGSGRMVKGRKVYDKK